MDEERLQKELSDLKKKEASIRKSTGFPGGDVNNADKTNPASPALRYTWLGAEFAAIFFGFVWGGYTLDARLGSKPWLLLTGIALGFGLALYRLIFVAKRLSD